MDPAGDIKEEGRNNSGQSNLGVRDSRNFSHKEGTGAQNRRGDLSACRGGRFDRSGGRFVVAHLTHHGNRDHPRGDHISDRRPRDRSE